jgi:hypothetical protein
MRTFCSGSLWRCSNFSTIWRWQDVVFPDRMIVNIGMYVRKESAIEIFSKRRQDVRQLDVNRAVINDKWWHQPFLHEITEERYTERKLTVDNLNFCVTRTRYFTYFHAPRKISRQCRRWNFIAKGGKTPFERWKSLLSISYCRITVSDHFYWFPFSVNITFYSAKVCFFHYLLFIKIVKWTG